MLPSDLELVVAARLLHALLSILCSFGNWDQSNRVNLMAFDVSVAELLAGLPCGLLCMPVAQETVTQTGAERCGTTLLKTAPPPTSSFGAEGRCYALPVASLSYRVGWRLVGTLEGIRPGTEKTDFN